MSPENKGVVEQAGGQNVEVAAAQRDALIVAFLQGRKRVESRKKAAKNPEVTD